MKIRMMLGLFALSSLSMMYWNQASATIAPMSPSQIAQLCGPFGAARGAYFCPPFAEFQVPLHSGGIYTIQPYPYPIQPQPYPMPVRHPMTGQIVYADPRAVWYGAQPSIFPMPPMSLPGSAPGGCFPVPIRMGAW